MTPICVISTTGTSVFSQANTSIQERWREFEKRTDIPLDPICNLQVKDFEGYDLYRMSLEVLRAQRSDIAAIRRASAELNSLSRIITTKDSNNRLTFLATDTPDGVLAARIVADFSAEFFEVPLNQVKIHRVQGLQVKDGRLFRQDGVRNLIAKIFDALEKAPSVTYHRVLNPTGGFKGVVPYLTVIGMIEEDVQVSYIFERSEELINLGRLPIQFNLEQLRPAYFTIQKVSQDYVFEADLLSELGLSRREDLVSHPVWPLLDQDTDNGETVYSTNGLGSIALRYLQEALNSSKVYLSKRAHETFEALDSTQRTTVTKLLKQMSKKDWRNQQKHGTHGAILAKPHEDFRFYYFEENDSIIIAEIARHSDKSYERLSSGPVLNRKDYPSYRALAE